MKRKSGYILIVCMEFKLFSYYSQTYIILSLHYFHITHLLNSVKTAPRFGDAAMGRIALGAKVGYIHESTYFEIK